MDELFEAASDAQKQQDDADHPLRARVWSEVLNFDARSAGTIDPRDLSRSSTWLTLPRRLSHTTRELSTCTERDAEVPSV
jgi:hypothetical protein